MFWDNKKILVTGGGGFIGSHLVERLLNYNSKVRVVDRKEFPPNLRNNINKIEYIKTDLLKIDNCFEAVKGTDIVFHLASIVGGIKYNISHHSEIFRKNVILNSNVLEASRVENVERYQCTSSTCVYPRYCTIPTPEIEGFVDEPDPTVLGYGWSKRIAEIQAKLYSKDYDMQISIIRPTNAYGPGDNFNLETSHVIPALIRKMDESYDYITIWGSGNQKRSFIYVEDLARAMMEVTEKYAVADPINIGTKEEISIKELSNLILNLMEKNIKLVFDKDKPEGQSRKFADITKAINKINWNPKYSLMEGLKKTIIWYKNNVYDIK